MCCCGFKFLNRYVESVGAMEFCMVWIGCTDKLSESPPWRGRLQITRMLWNSTDCSFTLIRVELSIFEYRSENGLVFVVPDALTEHPAQRVNADFCVGRNCLN